MVTGGPGYSVRRCNHKDWVTLVYGGCVIHSDDKAVVRGCQGLAVVVAVAVVVAWHYGDHCSVSSVGGTFQFWNHNYKVMQGRSVLVTGSASL